MERAPKCAFIRFYAELNDHLPSGDQFRTLEKTFYSPTTAMDMVESSGVPHPEVELILVNGKSEGGEYRVQDGDRLSVYPVFESFDVGSEVRLRREPLRRMKFVADVHLGKLAAYLRMIGFDTFYRSCYSDPELVRVANEQHRILLTRDRGLLKHGAITHGYWLRATDSRKQAAEIVQRFDLADRMQPFTRCMACNGMLREASLDEVRHLIGELTAELYSHFKRCVQCEKVYWQGSHYGRMVRFVKQLSVERSTFGHSSFSEDCK